MSNRPHIAAALFAALTLLPAVAQGEILITQAKALAGNVTPGDAAGFPVTLSVSGSYGLAGNLQPTSNKAGIRITNHDITIDLLGFRIVGGGVASIGMFRFVRAHMWLEGIS